MNIQPDQTTEDHKSSIELTLNRRQLYFALTACVVTIGACTDIPERLQRQNLLDRVLREVGQNRREAVRTLIESIAVWAGGMLVCDTMNAFSITHGTHAHDGAAAQNFSQNHPIRDYLHTNFTMPLFEEAVFRLLPSALFCEERPPNIKIHWVAGLTANTVFALLHNFSQPEPGKFTFTVDSLPLEQFILGAYCWYVQRTGGFIHAAGAHMLWNNLCTAYESSSDLRAAATPKD